MASHAPGLACTHCGLPSRAEYCCLGCRLAAAAAGDGGERGLIEARLVVSAFLAMGVMTFSFVLYGSDLLAAGDEPGLAAVDGLLRALLAALTFPVLLLLGVPIARGAWADLREGVVRMDGLILLAVLAAFGLSVHHMLRGSGAVYFETAAMVLLGVTFGRRLEAHARSRGRDAAETLADLLPAVAHAERGEVAPDSLRAGDACEVRPGEAVPADAIVRAGRSEVSAAVVTGEEAPRPVGPGDVLPAGALNGGGALQVEVLRPAGEGSLGAIRALLEAPLPVTARLRMADRVASWLVVAAVILAVAGGAAATARGGAGDGLRVALSVLLVACPCGLGLAMPLAYRAVRVALARHGVLVRDAAALERAAQVDTVLFDKTGTLTEPAGALSIVSETRPDAGRRLFALVARSGHKLADAVPDVPAVPLGKLEDVALLPGRGVEGRLDGRHVRAGSLSWLADAHWNAEVAAEAVRRAHNGASMVGYAEDGEVVALATVRQRLRPGAEDTLAGMAQRGLEAEVLSGDRSDAVNEIAAALGVPGHAEARPETKLARVTARRGEGGVVLLAGDGVNDAPALRAADVGVALGSGTALARGTAAVELVGDDLRNLGLLIDGSRELRRIVRGNVAWTLGYNAVALAAATAGWLHPLLAVAAMIVSSLVVAVRSSRLLGFGGAGPVGAGLGEPLPSPAAAEAVAA